MLDGTSTLVARDEEADHQSVHGRRVGKTHCAAHEPLAPGPQVEVVALDALRVLLADDGLLGGICRSYAPQPSVEMRVMPQGSNRSGRARKTVSCRRPKT